MKITRWTLFAVLAATAQCAMAQVPAATTPGPSTTAPMPSSPMASGMSGSSGMTSTTTTTTTTVPTDSGVITNAGMPPDPASASIESTSVIVPARSGRGELANTGGEPELMMLAGLVLATSGLMLRRKVNQA